MQARSITQRHRRYGRIVPAALRDILAEADRLLEPERFEDYCVNGVQVPGDGDGTQEVQRIATGVSAHTELFELAVKEAAQLLLVHHGIFWGPGVRSIDPQLKRRLRLLFDADMTLAAYHLPLDAHPELGNNALLAKHLGATNVEPFAAHHDQPIGFVATLPTDEGVNAAELFGAVARITSREPLVFDAGGSRIRRVAIVSGAGADYLGAAAAANADALLTGEAPERAMAEARELGIHLIAAGHYATETFGIRALGDHLAERFGLAHVFLDVPNPI